MHHPEAVLLVDDGQAQRRQLHVLFHQGVRSDSHLHGAFPQQFLQNFLFAGGRAAAEQQDVVTGRAQESAEIEKVLRGQNLGGSHQHDLVSVLDCNQGGLQGHDGFAAADVPLQQPVHRPGCAHVMDDFRQRFLLRGRGVKRQHLFQALPDSWIGAE